MSKLWQLQWRTTEAGSEWRFHSKCELEVAQEQIAAYHSRPLRAFDYRLVANDSPDALTPVAESVYVGRMETIPAVFPGGRSAA